MKHNIEGFLFTVSKNLWINKVKREKRMTGLENINEAYGYDYSPDIITKEKTRTLKEMIRKLGEKCYQLLQMAIYQQFNNHEICAAMGFSTVNAVKTQKYKCKQKLLELIKSNPTYKEVME